MRAKYVVIGVVVGILLSSVVVLAGSADPSSGPTDPTSQMYTLSQIYQRLDGGTETNKMASFTEPSNGPGTGTMRTLDHIMAVAPKVDDTMGATAADVVSGKTFWGLTTSGWGLTTGTAEAGADPPCFDNGNRYVDCGNGTVYDTVTNLIWLKDANCFGQNDWTAASYAAAGLEDGECGLTDGSSPNDWRLPTRQEWDTTVARAIVLSCTGTSAPLLTNKPGTACYSAGWPAFNNVAQTGFYWGSSASELLPNSAWVVSMKEDNSAYLSKPSSSVYVWPVRDAQ